MPQVNHNNLKNGDSICLFFRRYYEAKECELTCQVSYVGDFYFPCTFSSCRLCTW